MSYRVLFTESQKEQEVELLFGTVIGVSWEKRGVMARVLTPEGKEYKFWVRRPDSPGGARCHVVARKGSGLPTVLHLKKDFDVQPDLEVLFRRPKRTSASYPVILFEDYKEALEAIKHNQVITSRKPPKEQPLRKGQHRFVD